MDARDEVEADTGVKITTEDIQFGQFQERVDSCYIDKLKNNVRSSFSTSNEIISAFPIFEPKRVPKLDTAELESYGKYSVKTLPSHYGESKNMLLHWIAKTMPKTDYC